MGYRVFQTDDPGDENKVNLSIEGSLQELSTHPFETKSELVDHLYDVTGGFGRM